MSHKFVIVGAGLSGLSNAFFIKHFFPKAHITVVEQSNRVGGMIQTNKIDGFTCEEGPRSIRIGKYNHPLYHMIDKIGLYPEFIPSVQQPYSYIYWNGKLRSVPLKVNLETLTQFVKDNGLGEALSLAKSYPGFFMKQSTTDNLGEYLEAILGPELTQKYVESVYFGIYGESVYNLSKGLCFQKTHMQTYDKKKIEKELDLSDEFTQVKSKKLKGANSFRFVYGVDSLPKKIHRYLNENYSTDYEVSLNTKAKAIDFAQKVLLVDSKDKQEQISIPYDYLILNTPTHQMSQIMSSSNQHEIADVFRNVKCNSIFTRNICWNQSILPKEFKGFGYLINPKQEQNILGMVADSLSFPGQYPNQATNLSVMSLYDVNDSVILKELSQHLGTTIPDPVHIVTRTWSKAFTQFGPGHQSKMNKVEEQLNGKQVVIGGNNYTLAIPELVYMSYMKVKQLYV